MRKWIRRIWVTAGLTSMGWLFWNAQAHGVDPALLRSTAAVAVSDSGSIVRFTPATPAGSGLIFLPGATIEPKAYAPLLRAVAEAGYPVALVRLPWRMAPSAASRAVVWNRIATVQTMDPTRRWILAGHSRGAALSAGFAGEHPDALAGLVLIATTHPRTVDLSALPIPVTKIYGTRDCVADSEEVLANAGMLPRATQWVRLEGANHRQFGWYGSQLGDCSATMTRSAQQARTLDALLAALAAATGAPSI